MDKKQAILFSNLCAWLISTNIHLVVFLMWSNLIISGDTFYYYINNTLLIYKYIMITLKI